MFKKVELTTKFRKRDSKPANKTLCRYDNKPLCLDGQLEFDVFFEDHTMNADVYGNIDTPELLFADSLAQ